MSPKKKKIAVLFGGKSPEHDVSILTGLQVLSAVDPDLYESFPVYISAAGRWPIGETLRQRSSYIPSQSEIQSLTAVSLQIGMSNGPCLVSEQKTMFRGTQRIEFDFAIPSLHGLYGEDGRIQGLLESAGVPYSGMRPLASSTFMDKIATKRMLAATGIPQLPYWRIDRPQQGLLVTVDELARIVPDAKFPCCVKPARLGSSIGVARVEDYQELSDVLPNFFRYDSTAILEPFVTDLVEYNISVCRVDGKVRTSAVEMPKHTSEFLDFKAKYLSNVGKEGGSKSPAEASEGMLSLTREINPKIPNSLEKKSP